MLTFMYAFTARLPSKESMTGLIEAPSQNLAYHQIKRIGLTHIRVKLHLVQTMLSFVGIGINRRQLAMFYRIVSDRLKNGSDTMQSVLVQSQRFLLDARLKSMVMMFNAALDEGESDARAMVKAGFADRDAMIVQALSESAERSEAFKSLADEVDASEELRRRFEGMLRTPKFVGAAAYALIPGYVFFLSPSTARFLSQLGDQVTVPGWVTTFYAVLAEIRNAPVPFMAAFIALPVLLIWVARTEWFRRQLDRIPMLRDISEKRDHIALWHAYALMYRAGIAPEDALRTLAKAVRRPDTRRSVLTNARRLASGSSQANAVAGSNYPVWVSAGFQGAQASTDLGEGLMRFSANLRSDLSFAVENLTHYVDKAALIFMAAVVLLFFFVTVYPMTAPLLANL